MGSKDWVELVVLRPAPKDRVREKGVGAGPTIGDLASKVTAVLVLNIPFVPIMDRMGYSSWRGTLFVV